MRKLLRNESGYSIVIVFFIVILVSIFGLTLMTMNTQSLALSTHEREDQSIFYIAEAAITIETEEIEAVAEDVYSTFTSCPNNLSDYNDFIRKYNTEVLEKLGFNITLNDFTKSTSFQYSKQLSKTPNDSVTYSVTSNINESPLIISLTSSGFYNENPTIKRSLKKEIEVFPGIFPDCNNSNPGFIDLVNNGVALVVFNDLNLPGDNNDQKFIEGNALVHESIDITDYHDNIKCSPIPNPINPEDCGNFYPFNNIDPQSILHDFPIDKMNEYSKLRYPEDLLVGSGNNKDYLIKNGNIFSHNWITGNRTLNINSDIKINKLELNANYSLTLDVGDTEKNIYIDHLNMINGHIKIKGTGKVNIYTNKITTGSSSSFNIAGDAHQTTIYYNGSETIKFAGNQKFYNNLYIKNADLYSEASAGIYGNIFSGGGQLQLHGDTGAVQGVIAPFSEVIIGGSGKIYGSLIAKNVTATGGGLIRYNNTLFDIAKNPPKDYSNEKIKPPNSSPVIEI